ncbi:MAG: hypothetical protein H6830_04435 [Planctomycetes bacterium]|nr:hypothetical protein [Planctomycetota bacterium]MCB9910483.1 hypothetical protein [Planctomycetota bacterium]MCB9912609.1 hypothetical protein [Planctomycetota bacterium]HPF15029.1 hypothetical protein [Planctomycetota bacterium]
MIITLAKSQDDKLQDYLQRFEKRTAEESQALAELKVELTHLRKDNDRILTELDSLNRTLYRDSARPAVVTRIQSLEAKASEAREADERLERKVGVIFSKLDKISDKQDAAKHFRSSHLYTLYGTLVTALAGVIIGLIKKGD